MRQHQFQNVQSPGCSDVMSIIGEVNEFPFTVLEYIAEYIYTWSRNILYVNF
jgi:hypothetical protein